MLYQVRFFLETCKSKKCLGTAERLFATYETKIFYISRFSTFSWNCAIAAFPIFFLNRETEYLKQINTSEYDGNYLSVGVDFIPLFF
jgi:hypothetical protein